MFSRILKAHSFPTQLFTRSVVVKSRVDPSKYSSIQSIDLPLNVDPNESTRFSPNRARELNSSSLLVHSSNYAKSVGFEGTIDVTAVESTCLNPHVASYDCNNTVSLNSTMQSNVPQPFGGLHNYAISLAMPGGGWSSIDKFQAAQIHSSHYTALRTEFRSRWNTSGVRQYSTAQPPPATPTSTTVTPNDIKAKATEEVVEEKPLSKKEQVKKAFKEYGTTVIVFHVALSLASLGLCYLLVLNGLDVVAFIQKLGIESERLSTISNASTFVVAYAVHKVFSPVRLSITLFSVPIIVRYLRAKGILKMPVKVK